MSGSTARVIGAACGAIFTLIGCAIYLLVLGPVVTTVFETFETNTPLYWFTYLHGDMIGWIVPMIYFIILAVGGLSVFNIVASAFTEQTYYD